MVSLEFIFDFTEIFPFRLDITSLFWNRPIPEPLVVVKPNSKTRSRISEGIPFPLSFTNIVRFEKDFINSKIILLAFAFSALLIKLSINVVISRGIIFLLLNYHYQQYLFLSYYQ